MTHYVWTSPSICSLATRNQQHNHNEQQKISNKQHALNNQPNETQATATTAAAQQQPPHRNNGNEVVCVCAVMCCVWCAVCGFGHKFRSATYDTYYLFQGARGASAIAN